MYSWFFINIRTKEEQEQEEIKSKTQLKEQTEDIDLIGFRRVIDRITSLKLPLICHNGQLDILHVYQ